MRTLVVGADRGIARALVRQLVARGDDVVAACLGEGDDADLAGATVIGGIDVTAAASVDRLRETLATSAALDWVLHVAGVLGLDSLGSIDYDDVRRQLEINTLGPLRTLEAIAPLVRDGGRIGVVTSRVGSLGDNGSGGMYAYRISKAGANMVVVNLHHDLADRGISVLALHPGMVATDLTKDYPGDHAYITPEQAAEGIVRNMTELSRETSGRFRHANREYLPW